MENDEYQDDDAMAAIGISQSKMALPLQNSKRFGNS